MAKIRIGSIGLGNISTGVHIPGIQASPDLILTAICDADPERLRQRGEQYGIDEAHRFTDYQDLIACPDVDAVDISTPNISHFAIAMAAVAAGKPYGVEKPITMTAEEADILTVATRKAGLQSMVYFSYRYKAAARMARDIVLSGKLGRVHHVNMQYYQAWGLAEKNCPLVWRFVRSDAASGALGDLGCHGLDLVSFVTGARYEAVTAHLDTIVTERRLPDGSGYGRVDVDDFSNMLCKMTGGISASFQISRFAYGRGNYQRMEIYCEHGGLVYHLDRIPGVDELAMADASTGGAYVDQEIPEKYRVSQMQAFADLLSGKDDGENAWITDGDSNAHVLDAILLSAKTGNWVRL